MASIFAERIKNERNKLGLRQSDIAEHLGISVQSYSIYENGREPKYDLLIKLADRFNVSIDYLLGRTDWRSLENAGSGQDLGLNEVSIEILRKLVRSKDDRDIIRYINYLLTDDALAQLNNSFWYYLNLSNPGVLGDMTEYLDNAPQETASRLRENFLRLAREDALNAYAKFIDRAAKERRDRP